MVVKKDFSKILLLSLIFIPIIFILSELSLSLLSTLRNKDIPRVGIVKMKFDILSGWRGHTREQFLDNNDPKIISLDEHGLVKTPFESNKMQGDFKGILLLGNSVAMGHPIYSYENKKSFGGELEAKLRKNDQNIDLINGAYFGFSSWQEHIELARYLNSSSTHNNLPNLSSVISFGGIQDFWKLLELLENEFKQTKKDYAFANGLMISPNNLEKLNKYISYRGKPIENIQVLFSSLSIYFNHYTHTGHYINAFKYKLNNLLTNKKIIKDEVKDKYLNNKLTLEEIIKNRFGMKFSEYLRIRNSVIDSVVRNNAANKALIGESPYFYIYSPTLISSQPRDNNIKDLKTSNIISIDIGGKTWLLDELILLENSYREKLISEMKKKKNIITLDYSSVAIDKKWFHNISHFNRLGTKEITKLIANDIMIVLKKLL